MRASETRRDLIVAALAGLVLALAVGAGGAVMLASAERQALPVLTEKIRSGGETVGQAVAEQIRKALDYGIPAEGLYGVDNYFAHVVSGVPTIGALALVAPDGTVLATTAENVSGLTFPVISNDAIGATVVLAPAPPLFGGAVAKLRLALAATALLFGMIGACLAFLVLRGNVSAGRARLRSLMQDVSRQVFPSYSLPSGRGASVVALSGFDFRMAPLEASVRRLEDEVATVRAIDFDGSLDAKLRPILEPVAAARGIAEAAAPELRSGRRLFAVWLTVCAVGIYAMVVPFVANFAIDRQWSRVPAEWWPSLPWIGEYAAAMLAYTLARKLPPATRSLAALAGLSVAGFATAAVYVLREYHLFLETRLVAGAAIGVAVAALTSGRRGYLREPLVPVMLSLAILAVAPLLGGLLGEAVGRRMTFLTAGLLLVALAAVSLTVRWNTNVADGGTAAGWSGAAASAGIALGAVVLVLIPSGPGYENYLAGGTLIAAIGLAATFAPIPRWPIALIAVLAGLAWLSWSPAPIADLQSRAATVLAMVLIGAGTGGLIKAGRPGSTALMLSTGTGLIVGAGLASLAASLALPPLSIGAALMVVLCLADRLAARRPGSSAG